MVSACIHGFILALGLILPLGVQNVFVFNQGALQTRWAASFPVVLTAAICDTILISLAVFGVSVIVLGIAWIRMLLIGTGVIFLIYMGFATWKSKPGTAADGDQVMSARKQIIFAASVSLLNPHAILDTIGVIGTSSLGYSGSVKLAFMFAAILVSWLWFFGLSIAGHLTGKYDANGRFLFLLNKVSALIIWGTAIYLLFSLF